MALGVASGESMRHVDFSSFYQHNDTYYPGPYQLATDSLSRIQRHSDPDFAFIIVIEHIFVIFAIEQRLLRLQSR